jgi:hypothetical protein
MPRPPGYISLPTPYEDLMMREEQRKMGTIRQPTDKEKLFAKYPWVKDAAVMGDEMLGIAAGGRIMQAIEDQKSIMLRPQNLYEFFDRNAGVVANLGEVGLSAIDMVGAAPMVKQGVKPASRRSTRPYRVLASTTSTRRVNWCRWSRPVCCGRRKLKAHAKRACSQKDRRKRSRAWKRGAISISRPAS